MPPPTTTAATISAAMRMPWAMPRPRISASRSACALASRCALIRPSLSPSSVTLPWNAAASSGLIWRSPGPRRSAGSGMRITSSVGGPTPPGGPSKRAHLKAAVPASVKTMAAALRPGWPLEHADATIRPRAGASGTAAGQSGDQRRQAVGRRANGACPRGLQLGAATEAPGRADTGDAVGAGGAHVEGAIAHHDRPCNLKVVLGHNVGEQVGLGVPRAVELGAMNGGKVGRKPKVLEDRLGKMMGFGRRQQQAAAGRAQAIESLRDPAIHNRIVHATVQIVLAVEGDGHLGCMRCAQKLREGGA